MTSDPTREPRCEAPRSWRAPPPNLELRTGTVHVWRIEIPEAPFDRAPLLATLSEEELERASRFKLERVRDSFVVSHAALRRLLAQFSGVEARELRFASGPHGKPALASSSGLRFNLSHSGGLALIALSRDGEVGVDVEQIEPERAKDALAKRVMTSSEYSIWRALDRERRVATFFQVWSAKEALMKATGLGLALDPREIEVLGRNGELTPRHALGGSSYALVPLDAGDRWSAALALTLPASGRGFVLSWTDVARAT